MNEVFKKCPVSMILIVINIIIYIYTTMMYGIEMNVYEGMIMGGFNPVLVLQEHEYYRLITANFIHFGLTHILCNVVSMFNISMFVELSFKRSEYVIVIISSMLSTTLFPLILYVLFHTGQFSIMGGLSGVVFGLTGSLLGLALIYKDIYSSIFKSIFPSLALMIFISFVLPSISLTGHIGGFIGGFVSTLILKKNRSGIIN